MTMRTIACSCSLSGRPWRRRRTKARPSCHRPAGVSADSGSDVRGVQDAALCWQIDGDRGAGADRAADVERPPMELGQLDGEREPETGPRVGEPRRLADAPETRLGEGDVLL